MAAAGCGRIGFESGAPDGGPDAATDADAGRAEPCFSRYDDVITCDDFEIPGFAGWRRSGVGTIVEASRGTDRAIRVQTPSGTRGALLLQDVDPPLTDGLIYMRLFVREPSTVDQTTYVVLANLSDSMASTDLKMGLESMHRSQVGAPGAFDQGGTIPLDTWFCMELEASIAAPGSTGYARLYVDGTLVVEVPEGTDTDVPGGYALLQVGIASGVGNPDITVDLDDFVLARSPIGCT
jgi:hypothetical protein